MQGVTKNSEQKARKEKSCSLCVAPTLCAEGGPKRSLNPKPHVCISRAGSTFMCNFNSDFCYLIAY